MLGMQNGFNDFLTSTDKDYRNWQKAAIREVKAAREARSDAFISGVLGFAALAAAAALAGRSDSSHLETAGGVAAGITAGVLVADSISGFQTASLHKEIFVDLANEVDIKLAPQVVEFEGQKIELTGSAAEQYRKHYELLSEIVALEATPDRQL